MSDFLPFIVIGLATGAVYGLAGTGLVLTYKTSGIFNFAYGSVAALAVFLFYFLHTLHHVPWPVAAAICLFVMAPIAGLGLELLARILEPAGATLKVVATVGLILLIEGIGLLWHKTNPPTVPNYLPQSTVRMVGVNITVAQIILFVISVVASGLLYYFFRSVRLGIAMRGVVDNPDLVSMSGENPVRVRRYAWIIGTFFASLAGLLLGPTQQLDATALTTLIFAAFGAAAIGYFSNLPLTFLGGLLLGVAGALVDKYSATISWIGGLPPSLPFLVLFVVLVVTPRARLAERRLVHALPVRKAWHAPARVRFGTGAIAVAVFAVLPIFVGSHISVWSATLIDIILFLSLGLLVRTSGQISLCHLAFAAVGAAAFGHFSSGLGLPWLVAVVLAMLIAIPIGAVVAIPAIRLSGVFLALATLGFGIMLEELFYTRKIMFGPTSLGISTPRPGISIGSWHMGTDKGFYYVLLIAAVGTVAVVTAIQKGRLGRLLGALADSPVALETHGATSNVIRVLVFCISASLASLAGALTAMLYHFGVGTYFASFTSLTLVALVVIVTVGDPWFAVIAALGYAVVPGYLTIASINTYLEMLFGLFAVTAAIGANGLTVPQAVRVALDRLGGRQAEADVPVTAVRAEGAPRLAVRPAGSGLAVRDLSVHFGGVRAVDAVSLQAPAGRITGLVGPNGAGKTTTFNACSGLLRPTSGHVTLHGSDVTTLGPSGRARRGLGRTFQRTALFDSLTVRENIELGREASLAGRSPLAQMVSGPGQRATVAAAAAEAMEITGTGRLAGLQAGLLPAGQRRMVELARTLAGPFDMFLLDEPSSGLDAAETERFGEILIQVAAERGAGILVVEHDMSLVRQVCSHIYVLDFGQLIFEGSPDEMLQSDVVRTAYLGSEGAELDQVTADELPELA